MKEVELSCGAKVAVWGKPVYNHVPSFHPLGDIPERPEGCDFFVVMGHGLVLDDDAGGDFNNRSSPIVSAELGGADCDYIALGHVHIFRDCTVPRPGEEAEPEPGPPAFYCGAPGDIGKPSVALVELTEGQRATVEKLPMGPEAPAFLNY